MNYLLRNHQNSIFIVNVPATSKWENNEEIELFRQYLRIPTVQPHVNYGNENKINKLKLIIDFSIWHV